MRGFSHLDEGPVLEAFALQYPDNACGGISSDFGLTIL